MAGVNVATASNCSTRVLLVRRHPQLDDADPAERVLEREQDPDRQQVRCGPVRARTWRGVVERSGLLTTANITWIHLARPGGDHEAGAGLGGRVWHPVL